MKKTRLTGAMGIFLLLFFVLCATALRQCSPTPPPPQPVDLPIVHPVPSPPPRAPQPRKMRIHPTLLRDSKGYAFTVIEQHLQTDRLAITACFMLNSELPAGTFQLYLEWKDPAQPVHLLLEPSPGLPSEDCLTHLIESWDLPMHPGMQPFAYRTAMKLGH